MCAGYQLSYAWVISYHTCRLCRLSVIIHIVRAHIVPGHVPGHNIHPTYPLLLPRVIVGRVVAAESVVFDSRPTTTKGTGHSGPLLIGKTQRGGCYGENGKKNTLPAHDGFHVPKIN